MKTPSGDRLEEIMAAKRDEIAGRTRPVYPHDLQRFKSQKRKGVSFLEALGENNRLSVIGEIKRRSPSAGEIAAMADAPEQARRYYNAGVDAISVLTDEVYFGGKIQDLWDVTDLLANREDAPPCLRKDFMVHPVQVVEAAEAGARAILLIVRALADDAMRTLREAADLAGLDSLYEIHEEAELERALAHDARIIGVNNRDLTRFVTDLSISEALLPKIPDDCVRVSESGIFIPEDAQRARDAGADAILVGEALMRADDPESLIEAFHACT